jgi:hypothetical protein
LGTKIIFWVWVLGWSQGCAGFRQNVGSGFVSGFQKILRVSGFGLKKKAGYRVSSYPAQPWMEYFYLKVLWVTKNSLKINLKILKK